MANKKNYDDVAEVLSEQIDVLTKKGVTAEQRKTAQALSRVIGCYISMSVHKLEYDQNSANRTDKMPIFENRTTRGK